MARSSKHSGAKFANGNYKSYQKKYDGSKLQISKRSALNKENRRRGTMVMVTVKMYHTRKMVKHSLKKHLKTEHVKAEHDPITSNS